MSTSFATPEGLRSVLNRLHDSGPSAWAHDREATRLLKFAIRKYQPLAAAHRCEPDDTGYAAFEALRTRAVRNAEDPWAVVTRAVQVSLIAEERAALLLCSPGQARRGWVNDHHHARRFSEHDTDLTLFHKAFQIPAHDIDDQPDDDPTQQPPTGAFEALDLTIALFGALGWPMDTASAALNYVAARMIESGNRPKAHAALRRDETGRALADLDRTAWATFLRIVLGNPDRNQAFTAAGHGVLTLLVCGYTVTDLLADDGLVLEISSTAPAVPEADYV